MSLCSALDPLEDFLLAAATEGPGHGLNLSTNNGLDLTCQNYEGLNLSQHANPLNQGTSSNSNSSAPVVLNLTHPSLPNQQAQQQLPGNHPAGQHHNQVLTQNNIIPNFQPHGIKSFVQREQQQMGNQTFNTEVGLNLSLQNGINLSRQAGSQGSRPNIELGYYYNDFSGINSDSGQQSIQNSDGANFSFNPRVNGDTSTYSIDQQRNSPLNLEHRSSPLNLTSVVPHQQQIRNFQHPKSNINTASVQQQQHSGCPNLPQQPQQQNQNNYFSSNDQFNWTNLFYNQTGCSQQNELDLFQSNDVADVQHGQVQANLFSINDQNSLQQNSSGYDFNLTNDPIYESIY